MCSAIPAPSDKIGSASDTETYAEGSSSPHRISDRELVEGIRQGDAGVFEHLFQAQYESLCAFALSYVGTLADAEDLVTDVFTWIWTHHDTFDPPSSVAAYLYAAVRNRALNLLRRLRYDRALQETVFESASIPGMGNISTLPDQILELRDTHDTLRQALLSLPPHTRRLLALRWGSHMSIHEISITLGISEAAVKMQLNRAMKALQNVYTSFQR